MTNTSIESQLDVNPIPYQFSFTSVCSTEQRDYVVWTKGTAGHAFIPGFDSFVEEDLSNKAKQGRLVGAKVYKKLLKPRLEHGSKDRLQTEANANSKKRTGLCDIHWGMRTRGSAQVFSGMLGA